MAKKLNPYADWKDYPIPVQTRSGCKVSWNYYENEEDAKACSDAAFHNANIAASQGYDFGYCAPGSIRHVDKTWTDYKEGWYEVCLP
jgi:hypothetical protein